MNGQFRRITLAEALAEPEHERLFGSAYTARQAALRREQQPGAINRKKYEPWRKPRIVRGGGL